MTRGRKPPMAQSPLVALAERALEAGAFQAVIAWLNADGQVECQLTNDLHPVLAVGILHTAATMLATPETEA